MREQHTDIDENLNDDFDVLSIQIASQDVIRNKWSRGEVKKTRDDQLPQF